MRRALMNALAVTVVPAGKFAWHPRCTSVDTVSENRTGPTTNAPPPSTPAVVDCP
jgi:hypothetical protein